MISKERMERALAAHQNRSNGAMMDAEDEAGITTYVESLGFDLHDAMQVSADYSNTLVGGPIRNQVAGAIEAVGPEMAMVSLMSPKVIGAWVAASFHEGMIVGLMLGREDAASAQDELERVIG